MRDKITSNDLFLLLWTSLLSTLAIRAMIYSKITGNSIVQLLFAGLISIGFIAIALLFRKRENKKLNFVSDFMFKLLYSVFVTFFNQVYAYIVYDRSFGDLMFMFILVFFVFNLSFLGSLLAMPLNFFIKKTFRAS